jgi:sensor histidine kinase YesM
MNALTATTQYAPGMPASVRKTAPATPGAGLRINGHAAIFSVAAVLALATAAECHSLTHFPSLLYGAVQWLWWACLASVMWKISQRIPFASSFSPLAILIHLTIGSVLGVIHLLLLASPVAGGNPHAITWSALTSLLKINCLGIEVLLYGFLFGIIGIMQFQVQAQREAVKSLELQKQLSTAHLRALQMQLEPHFLFNTLNAITTLVELKRTDEAAEMLSHLNAILKSTLTRTTPEKVPLSQELEIIENYLAIEQVRFADRLHVQIKVEPGALDGLVPCFLLQPIVENAIRHGIANCENEGLVEASARREGATLHLRVRDSGPGLSGNMRNGHGIGLKNTRERLAHFYPGEYALKAQPLDTGGFEVAIAIPYEHGLR